MYHCPVTFYLVGLPDEIAHYRRCAAAAKLLRTISRAVTSPKRRSPWPAPFSPMPRADAAAWARVFAAHRQATTTVTLIVTHDQVPAVEPYFNDIADLWIAPLSAAEASWRFNHGGALQAHTPTLGDEPVFGKPPSIPFRRSCGTSPRTASITGSTTPSRHSEQDQKSRFRAEATPHLGRGGRRSRLHRIGAPGHGRQVHHCLGGDRADQRWHAPAHHPTSRPSTTSTARSWAPLAWHRRSPRTRRGQTSRRTAPWKPFSPPWTAASYPFARRHAPARRQPGGPGHLGYDSAEDLMAAGFDMVAPSVVDEDAGKMRESIALP